MLKIDTIKAILGTKKVAYNVNEKEAMYSKDTSIIMYYKCGEVIIPRDHVDRHVIRELLSDGWEVTEEEYDFLSDFEFLPQYKAVTPFEMMELIVENGGPVECQMCDFGENWKPRICTGVDLNNDYVFRTSTFSGYAKARVKVK